MTEPEQVYTGKYSLDIVSKRQKLLLPVERKNLEDFLNIWIGDFEPQIYDKFEELEITGAEEVYYMAYCKRVFQAGLRFFGSTLEVEWEALKDEFELRGLDRDKLDGLDGVLKHKIYKYRGIPEETLLFKEDWGYGGVGNMGKMFAEDWAYDMPPPMGNKYNEAWSS